MKKKIFSLALVGVMIFSMAIPAFAVTDVDHPDFNRDKLRETVVGQTSSVAGLITSILPADTIKDLAKDAISGMLDLSDIGNMVGPALGSLLEDYISDSLSITLPESIIISDIINDVLTNEYVNSILTSDFVGKVIDRTIDNLIDALVIEDIIEVLADSVVDQLTDEIWNNGDPSSSSYNLWGLVIQTGHWNTTGGWNTTNISISIAAKISGITGNADSYIDISKIDFTKIFSTDAILEAMKKAVIDTSTEYYETYKSILIEKVQEMIGKLKEEAKAELINELNKIFELKLSIRDELEDIEAKIIAHIHDSKAYVSANKGEIINDLKDLKKIVNKVDKYSCLDLVRVNTLLDKLIECLEEEVMPAYYTVTFDSAGGSSVDSQEIEQGGLAAKPEDPTRDSYTFEGWYYISTGDEELFNFDEMRINGDITLTAKWTPINVDPVLVSVDPFAVVEKLNGNKNNLTISLIETYSDGSTRILAEKTFSINNNAADTYEVSGYNVYVETKGNVQIRACYIVK